MTVGGSGQRGTQIVRKIADFAQIELGLHMFKVVLHEPCCLGKIAICDCVDNFGVFVTRS